ncbi:hypothetical protein SOVF_178020 [Spinacia oleracea]|nr:hypothetical protein SOVF_178020 [Spinacia oleracea]
MEFASSSSSSVLREFRFDFDDQVCFFTPILSSIQFAIQRFFK